MELNPPQLEAVTTPSGPLLVLAGAGTGKTRVVTHRIARLIRRGTRPERILAVTFTNKAANEMRQRVASLIGKRSKENPEISTFHSLCVRVLRRNIRSLGYPTTFAIYDRGDQESVARSALREIRVGDALLRPGQLINSISRWKTSSIRPERAASVAETDREHLAAAAYRRYQKALKAAGALDFDDLLLCTEELFRKDPEVPVTLIAGCCMICPPCPIFDPATGRCVARNAMALRDEKKDLDTLQLLGLEYGDTLTARELFARLYERIQSTTQVCGYGDGNACGYEWSVCNGSDGSEGYVKGRAVGLGL